MKHPLLYKGLKNSSITSSIEHGNYAPNEESALLPKLSQVIDNYMLIANKHQTDHLAKWSMNGA